MVQVSMECLLGHGTPPVVLLIIVPIFTTENAQQESLWMCRIAARDASFRHHHEYLGHKFQLLNIVSICTLLRILPSGQLPGTKFCS